MSLPHFFAGAPERGAEISLEPADARHAVRSLRLRSGDRLTSSDGRGALVVCRIVRADRDGVTAEVEARSVDRPPAPHLSVLLAPPKGERLAWAAQKLTEVGADRLVLLETRRSVRRWARERAGRAAARVEAVAREAAKQARRRFLLEVAGPMAWDEALAGAVESGPAIVLWEEATTGLTAILPDPPPAALSLVVGPEGGILAEEAREAERAGALLASLGANILRTETAALAAAAIALARYGRLGDRGVPLDPSGPPR